MPKLIIVRGNSGSGKTTIANMLQRKTGRNTLLISQDIVRREMLWAGDGENTPALPLLVTLLKYGREHCPYVILEGIFKTAWYMPLFEAAEKEFGTEIYAYYYDISFEETLKRHETKAKKTEFGEAEMRSWWNDKDYIGIIPERIFTADVGLSDAVDLICQDLMIW